MSQRSRQAGFTLIELIIVVAIITVVIVFLRPPPPLPSCTSSGETPYTQLPVDSISRVRNIEPLGLLSAPGHTYPTDHIYVWFNRASPTDRADLYAPGNIRVIQLTSHTFLESPWRAGLTDYVIDYTPCREARGTFGHIASLEGPLAPWASRPASEGTCDDYHVALGDPSDEHVQQCRLALSLDVPVGTRIGQVSGPTAQQLDWGMTDERVTNAYITPSRFHGGILHGVCPLNYFIPSLRSDLEVRLAVWVGDRTGSGALWASTVTPPCGTLTVDIGDTAQGVWVQDGSTEPVRESDQLTLAPHYAFADAHTFSVGIGLTDVVAGTYYFVPRSTGTVNRRFADVTSDGRTYCYETHADLHVVRDPTLGFSQSFLLRRNADGRLTLEGIGRIPCGSGPWSFGANQKTYIR